jgi:hypothetical protein
VAFIVTWHPIFLNTAFGPVAGTESGIKLLQTVHLGVAVASEQETTRLPVRSALFKQRTGGLVVRWVTTSESPLLNVFVDILEFLLGSFGVQSRYNEYEVGKTCPTLFLMICALLTSVII